MPCKKRCHARLHGSARLVSARYRWLRPSRPLSRHMVTACNNSRVVRCFLARPPDSTKASLGSSTMCVIASIRPQLLDGLQALASAQLIIILLMAGFSAATCAIIANALALARATIPLTSSSACSVIALASALASFTATLAGFC